MSGINRVIIVGRLGKDPEIRYTADGKAVANMSVATSEEWKDKQTGDKQSKTEWHRIVIFGKLADIAGKYLKKGSQAYFEGKLQTRKWQDQNGQDRYSTEIVANVMQMLGSSQVTGDDSPKQEPQQQEQQRQSQQGASPDNDGFSDDIPFTRFMDKSIA